QPLLVQSREPKFAKRRSVRSQFISDDNRRDKALATKKFTLLLPCRAGAEQEYPKPRPRHRPRATCTFSIVSKKHPSSFLLAASEALWRYGIAQWRYGIARLRDRQEMFKIIFCTRQIH